MIITSKLPYFVFSAIYLIMAWGIIRYAPFCNQQARNGATGRYETLDGLRGFLALGVFFHHSIISFFYYSTGKWEVPPSRFYTLLGQASVSLFFMITGFLFIGKILNSNGRLDISKFFASRIRRIVPMYLFSAVAALALIAITTHFRIAVPIRDLIQQGASWFMFSFEGLPNVNGLHDSSIVESVYWTLAYEWRFYLALPAFAFLILNGRFFACLCAAFAYSVIFSDYFTINFAFGALAAWVVKSGSMQQFCQKKASTVVPLAALALVFARFDSSYELAPAMLLFIFFLFIVHNNSLFGLLKMKAASYLGVISYSVYLMHSLVLFAGLRIFNHFRPITTIKPAPYWLSIGLIGGITIAISTLTYQYIEYRYYHSKTTTNRADMVTQSA